MLLLAGVIVFIIIYTHITEILLLTKKHKNEKHIL